MRARMMTSRARRIPDVISSRLRDALKLADGQHWRFAQAIGVHPTTLSRWISGAQPPRSGDPRVVALGALVGVPADACFAEAAPGIPDRVAV